MSKRKQKRQTYKRENKIYTSKILTLPRNKDLLISYDKGQFILANENGIPYDLGSQSMVRSYQGASNERIIAQATDLDFMTDHVGSWPENFDYIFAMDTNTYPQKCDDFFCSVAAIYYGEVQRISDYERNMTCKPYMIIDWYHPCALKIETVTWMEVIKKLQERISANRKVGIVIDSELGNLEGYNNRTIPILGQWYLPENYTFMYATADATDEWCNKIIRECDKSASRRLTEVVAAPRLKKISAGGNAPIGFISYLNNEVILDQ